MLYRFPITLDLGLWYADLTLLSLAVVLALAFYGFAVSRTAENSSKSTQAFPG